MSPTIFFRTLFSLALLFLSFLPSFSQTPAESGTMTKKEMRKARPTWLGISYGLDFDNFRDLGTSPLTYSGTLQVLSLEEVKQGYGRYNLFRGSYAFGRNSAPGGSSSVKSVFFQYSRLYTLPTPQWERWTIDLGGTVGLTSNERINPSFGNTRQGFEFYGNLFASGRLQWDISRKEAKQKKLLFLNLDLPERRKNLAFQLNLGLLNANWRNGYAYIGHDGALNQDRFFDQHRFHFLEGFRASTALEYNWFMKNGNGLRLAYRWDAYTSGGDYNRFAMAHHIVQFSFLFNTK